MNEKAPEVSNKKIESAARKAVIQYEEKHKRILIPNSGDGGYGYDIATKSRNGRKRFIEIKSTKKAYLSNRWLEPHEFKALMKNKNFWLYAVVDSLSNPRVKPFSRDEVLKHYDRDEIKHWFKFSKNEFTDTNNL